MDKPRPENKKTELTVVLQSIVKRALTKEDVVYETAQVDCGFQSTVKLLCLQGEEYVGEACETEKAAEHAAAHQALLVNADTVAQMPPSKPNRRSKAKKTGQEALWTNEGAAAKVQARDAKTDLVIQLQGHCHRPMTKADVLYETLDLSGSFQSTVRLACLPTKPEFAGSPQETEKAAEKSAAEQALLEQATWSPVVAPPGGRQPAQRAAAQAAPQGPDHKTELTMALQKIAQRTLTKGDVVYDVQEYNGQYIATVRLVCLNGLEYTGQPKDVGKAAEHAAAQRALVALSAQAAAAPPSKRSMAATTQNQAPQQQAAPEAVVVPRPAKAPRTVQPLGFLPGGRPFGVETLRAS